MAKTNYLEEFTKISHLLPLDILLDIDNRIKDWIVGGGKETDEYINQQLKYAKGVIEKIRH